MKEVTLESLARRVEAIERALDLKPLVTDKNAWHRAVGMFDGSEFMRQVDEEGRKIREAERAQAQQETME
jgi:hypothetical protein